MTKLLKNIILLTILTVAVIFSVSNREYISLAFWPLPYKVEMPIYLLLITIFVLSTILCVIISFLSNSSAKSELKKVKKLLKKSEEEVETLTGRVERLKANSKEN